MGMRTPKPAYKKTGPIITLLFLHKEHGTTRCMCKNSDKSMLHKTRATDLGNGTKEQLRKSDVLADNTQLHMDSPGLQDANSTQTGPSTAVRLHECRAFDDDGAVLIVVPDEHASTC